MLLKFVLTFLLLAHLDDAIVADRGSSALETEMNRVQGEIENTMNRMHDDRDDPEELMKVKIQIESLQSRSKRLRDEIMLATDFQNQLTDTASNTVKETVKSLLSNRTQEQQNSVFRVVEKVADRLMEEMVNETKSQTESEEKAMKDAIRNAEEEEKRKTKEANMIDEPLKATGTMDSAAAGSADTAADNSEAAAGAVPNT